MNTETVGGRKFILTGIVTLATVLLTWFAKIHDSVFATVILGTVGVYIAGNVAAKHAPAPKPVKK